MSAVCLVERLLRGLGGIRGLVPGKRLEFFPLLQFPPGLSEGPQTGVGRIFLLFLLWNFSGRHTAVFLLGLLSGDFLFHGLEDGHLLLLEGLLGGLRWGVHRAASKTQDLETFRLAPHHVPGSVDERPLARLRLEHADT